MNDLQLREASFSNYFTNDQNRDYSQLTLTVHEARFITYSKRQSMIFARIIHNNQQQTTTLMGNENLNPKWNQTMLFTLRVGVTDSIEIQVHDQMGMIGNASLNLRELISINNLEEWYSISDKKQMTGSIRLTFTFQQGNRIQKCLEMLHNITYSLECKLKQQRIASPTVGQVQIMQNFLNKQKTNSNIINSEYQIGNEFELHSIKGLMNEIKTLQAKFLYLQQQKNNCNLQPQKIQMKQQEVQEMTRIVSEKQDQLNLQISLLQQLSKESSSISKMDIILSKYKKKQKLHLYLRQKLNENKYLHIEKRGTSLAVQGYKYEGRPRLNHSEFQQKRI